MAEEPGELFAFALAGLPSVHVESIPIMQGLTFSRKAIAALVAALLAEERRPPGQVARRRRLRAL